MDYKQHKGNLRGQIKNQVERKLYNKRIRAEAIDVDTSEGQLTIPDVMVELPDYELDFCEKCFQMTNHLNGICQKCKGN